MSTDLKSLSEAALALDVEERYLLAQRLWESVEDEELGLDEETKNELRRRRDELLSGAVPALTHEEVMREVRNTLRCE